MSEIQLLTDQIEILHEALKPLHIKFGVIVMAGVSCTIFGGMFALMMQHPIWTGIAIIGLILLLITFGSIYPDMVDKQDEYRELVSLRTETIRAEIMAMECEPMRLDIIHKIENEQDWYMKDHYEFEKDLYYHRCEIPLRSEIMKLQ